MKLPCGSRCGVHVAAAIAILAGLATAHGEPLVTSSSPRPLGKGSVVVLRPAAATRETPPKGVIC